MKDWERRHNEARAAIGMAPYGPDYWRGCCLPRHVQVDPALRAQARAKLEALARSGDSETREIAQEALDHYACSDE